MNIQNAYNSYGDDAQYDPFARRGYNSNNFVTSLVQNTGGGLPFGGNAPGIDPGYGSTLPGNYTKSTGQSYVPNTTSQAVSGASGYGSGYSLQQISSSIQQLSRAVEGLSKSISKFLSK